jgi:hypothetical protein
MVALTMMNAFGQNADAGGGAAAPPPVQEYLILEPDDLIFNSIDTAAQFIRGRGSDGWIFPDGTKILAHTFEPGTARQYTRFLIRGEGVYTEESPYLILRRQAR